MKSQKLLAFIESITTKENIKHMMPIIEGFCLIYNLDAKKVLAESELQTVGESGGATAGLTPQKKKQGAFGPANAPAMGAPGVEKQGDGIIATNTPSKGGAAVSGAGGAGGAVGTGAM